MHVSKYLVLPPHPGGVMTILVVDRRPTASRTVKTYQLLAEVVKDTFPAYGESVLDCGIYRDKRDPSQTGAAVYCGSSSLPFSSPGWGTTTWENLGLDFPNNITFTTKKQD